MVRLSASLREQQPVVVGGMAVPFMPRGASFLMMTTTDGNEEEAA